MELIKKILNYQFGNRVGDKILENYKIKIEKSKNTGRIRRIYVNEKLFGTIEPTTGFIIPTFYGGKILKRFLKYPKYRVVIADEAIPFVSKCKSVFCKFVLDLDEEILPSDVVLVVDRNDNLVAIGISLLSATEIKQFNYGVAVKVKHCNARENNKI